MEEDKEEPEDNLNLVYIIFLLHGIGTWAPYNFFINAYAFFLDHKFSESYLGRPYPDQGHITNFFQHLTFCSQFPSMIVILAKFFFKFGATKFLRKISIAMWVSVSCFAFMIFVVVFDTSCCPEALFYVLLVCVIIVNIARGVYQNCLIDLVLIFPSRYIMAINLGNNICGIIVTLISIISKNTIHNLKIAGIFYFAAAVLLLLVCLHIHFIAQLNKYFSFNVEKYKSLSEANETQEKEPIPYLHICKNSATELSTLYWSQLITATMFPAILANVRTTKGGHFIVESLFTDMTCFLNFHSFSFIGALTAIFIQWPSSKYLWRIVLFRILYIPFYLSCNYQIPGKARWGAVLFGDFPFVIVTSTMGFTTGYCTIMAISQVMKSAESEYVMVVGILAGVAFVSGLVTGIALTFLYPVLLFTDA